MSFHPAGKFSIQFSHAKLVTPGIREDFTVKSTFSLVITLSFKEVWNLNVAYQPEWIGCVLAGYSLLQS